MTDIQDAPAQGTQTAFRKKPVVINAVLWDGNLTTVERLGTYSGTVSQDLGAKSLQIETLEGVMTAQVGDWIIRGVKGELYPCKPDIFAATYEPALAPTPPSSEPVAWQIRVREGCKTYHAYTERLPFEPDVNSGVIAISEPVPLYAHQPAAGAEREEFKVTLCDDGAWMVHTEGDVICYAGQGDEEQKAHRIAAALNAPHSPVRSGMEKASANGFGCVKPDNDRQVFFYEQDFYVLSNFSAFSLQWKDRHFDTSEAAYHWEKFCGLEPNIAVRIIEAPSAHAAFKLAEKNKHLRRSDWDDVKVEIMREILRAKADQHEYVRRKLLATGDRELIEDSWRDDFWGWGPNRDGKNMLGKLWMEIRAELRAALKGGSHE
jgi:hypothetical protein